MGSQCRAILEEEYLKDVFSKFYFRFIGTFALECRHLPLHPPVLPPWAGVHTGRAEPGR